MKATMNKVEFAARVGISVRLLEDKMRERSVPFVRIGARVLFTERHVEEFLDSCEVKAVRPRPPKRVAS